MNNVRVAVFKSVVYIPHWLQAMMNRRNIPLGEILNYSKMKEVLSQEDLATLLALQPYKLFDAAYGADGYPLNHVYSSAGTQVTDDTTMTDVLSRIWSNGIAAEDVAGKSILESVRALSYDSAVQNELKTRLFAKESFSEQHKQPFITYDLSREVIGVVVYPGYFTPEKNPSFKMDLLKSILKVLYVYNTYASVCKTPYFRKYLEELAVLTSLPITAK